MQFLHYQNNPDFETIYDGRVTFESNKQDLTKKGTIIIILRFAN